LAGSKKGKGVSRTASRHDVKRDRKNERDSKDENNKNEENEKNEESKSPVKDDDNE